MTNSLIDRIPSGVYWKLRHLCVALMNLPFQPIYLAWLFVQSLYYNIIDCFICDGSSQIDPFWKWDWRSIND